MNKRTTLHFCKSHRASYKREIQQKQEQKKEAKEKDDFDAFGPPNLKTKSECLKYVEAHFYVKNNMEWRDKFQLIQPKSKKKAKKQRKQRDKAKVKS